MSAGILAIDIGGSAIKAAVVDEHGRFRSERLKAPTPRPCAPARMVDEIAALAAPLSGYDRISIGFPGVIRNDRVRTAVNIGGPDWFDFPLAGAVSERLGKPARIVNDADMQGFALVRGEGVELVITLGTGLGSAWFRDGELLPHMELGHHPLRDNETYEARLGAAALERVGEAEWNRRLEDALRTVQVLLNADHIYLGGGNARHVNFALPAHVSVGSNEAGVIGGAALWYGAAAVRGARRLAAEARQGTAGVAR